MLVRNISEIADLIACPLCGSGVNDRAGTLRCQAPDCDHHRLGIDTVAGRPVLVDFANSVLHREETLASDGASAVVRSPGRALLARIVDGRNHYAAHYARTVVRTLEDSSAGRPLILVIGGGTIGSGAEALYRSDKVGVISIDIYASPQVTLVADALSIPLKDASVDAVWVQAVLEHTADAPRVAAEMRRVLKPGGLVFANTAFMWPVCEGAFDFTRFTATGLRWLFRDCEPLALGYSNGPGTMAALAMRYLFQSLLRSTKLGQVAALPFAWLRLLDRWCDARRGLDAAPAIFFFGRKTGQLLDPPGAIRFYDEQVALATVAQRLRN